MKKAFCFIAAALAFLFLFASCQKETAYPIEIENEKVSSGVFAYYLDRVLSNPKDYSLKAGDAKAAKNAAVKICKEKLAVKKLMKDNDIDLSLQYKSEAAQKTEDLWSLYSRYYTDIGISKPDITDINVFENQKRQLVQFYFGPGGKKPVSDEDLKQKFVEMYAGFKAFEGSFTNINAKGETVEMTESEKEKLVEKFRTMANKVDSGESIDDVYEAYCKRQGLVATEKIEVSLTKSGDPMYADDFFEKIMTISHGRAAPVISGSSIYVVQRVTIATNEDDVFEQYRNEVLLEMKMPAVQKKIESTAKKLKAEKNDEEIDRIYSIVAQKQK